MSRTTSTLIVLLLTGGLLTLSEAGVDTDTLDVSFIGQDPPVIPRALTRRSSDRPQRFVRTELFFGTEAPEGEVTEEAFLAFLDAEVSPRFPDGLTLFKGHGRFTGENGELVKEEPFVVILLHPADRFASSNRKIEEIRSLYKTRFRQESVLRVDYQFSVRVTF
jgi:hypothetical protein